MNKGNWIETKFSKWLENRVNLNIESSPSARGTKPRSKQHKSGIESFSVTPKVKVLSITEKKLVFPKSTGNSSNSKHHSKLPHLIEFCQSVEGVQTDKVQRNCNPLPIQNSSDFSYCHLGRDRRKIDKRIALGEQYPSPKTSSSHEKYCKIRPAERSRITHLSQSISLKLLLEKYELAKRVQKNAHKRIGLEVAQIEKETGIISNFLRYSEALNFIACSRYCYSKKNLLRLQIRSILYGLKPRARYQLWTQKLSIVEIKKQAFYGFICLWNMSLLSY